MGDKSCVRNRTLREADKEKESYLWILNEQSRKSKIQLKRIF